jgi:arginyl-tRNA synthetase
LEKVKKKIKNFIDEHNLRNNANLNQKKKEKNDLGSKISELNEKIQEHKIKVKHIKEKQREFLEPYQNESEIKETLEEIVHNKYRIIFFKDSLERTLQDIRDSKLKAIKQLCNKMWVKFKESSQMHSIEWDENFKPIINMGNTKRNIYQLSASEKVLIYFSIRASLLAELGPNFFLVVDNLLNPFMKENQKIIIDLLEDVIDSTDIEQIIFTGFDISSDFTFQKKITL